MFGPTCAIDAFPGQGKRGSQASSAAPEAREHMGESADPFRLAIGVFHEPERLESAISDLFADSFAARDMCLVGTRQAFDRLLPAPVAELGKEQLTRQLQPLSPLADDLEIVATSGDLLSTLLSHAKWQGAASGLGSSPLQDLLARSFDHIGRGAIALLVSAPDPALQHRSSRILLRRSAHTVQTHEFTPR
jgi:hypothetical protein